MGLHIGFLKDWRLGAQPRDGECVCREVAQSERERVLIACAEHAHARAGDFIYAVEVRQTTDDQPMD